MSTLITLDNVSLSYGLNPLLDKIKFQINESERICLIGRNGAGKSSLLKIIEGSLKPDSGAVFRKPHLRLSRLEQTLPKDYPGTVYDFVSSGLNELGKLLADYHHAIQHLSHHPTPDELSRLEKLQHELDVKQAWEGERRIKTVLERLTLNPDEVLINLSGGWKRRAALAKALVSAPDLLLLDEPTNHLDIQAIEWLENELLNSNIALLFITHDRKFLKRLATRIIELDRGALTSWPSDYENFLRRKEELLHAEIKQQKEFDKKLSQEEAWIRQGIKARRTRNEGRVRALESMRAMRAKRIEKQGKANFSLNQAEQSGQLVIEAKNITHTFGEKTIIKNFSTRIMRGDKIGLIGPNGIGKTTLLNILLANIEPSQGKVNLGTKLQIAYFDQSREALSLEETLIDNVAEGQETIEINGQKKHIISYLGDFLFTPQRALTPVKALSGGECHRLLLAKLFSKPFNVLIMDEPTNDLDIETLELLEELLNDYSGTLLLISHDRDFIDHIVTSTFIFDGNGGIEEHVGGYQEKLIQPPAVTEPKTKTTPIKVVKENKKLSYKEQRELDELPDKIEALEAEKIQLTQLTENSDFYNQPTQIINDTFLKLEQLNQSIDEAYIRFEVLSDKQ